MISKTFGRYILNYLGLLVGGVATHRLVRSIISKWIVHLHSWMA